MLSRYSETMRTGSTRRRFLGALVSVPAGAAVTRRAAGEATLNVGQQPSIQGTEEWPAFGFDATNSGHNPNGSGPVEDVGGVWTVQTGGRITAAPAVADGSVYFGSQDGRVYGVDASSGDELDEWPVNIESGISSSPVVANGTVYVATLAGDVFALDAETGDQQWQFGTGSPIEGPLNYANETVYTANRAGVIYAIDAADGESQGTEDWSFETDEGFESGPAVAPIEAEDAPDQMLFIGDNDSSIYAFDAESGDPEWVVESFGAVNSTPAVADETVYVGSLVANNPGAGALYAIDVASGEDQWLFNADGAVVGSPAVADGTVYVGSRSDNLFAVDTDDGSLEWEFDTGFVVTSSPAVADGAVYVTSESNSVFGVSTDGEQLWEFETNNSISASPAVANGVVYTGSDDRTMYALAEGGDIEGTGGASDEDDDFESSDDDQSSFAFLVIPASIGGFFAFIAGLIYAVIRSGIPDRFDVDEAPIEKLYEDEEDSIPDYDDRSQSQVWEMIVGDVIRRAETTDKTATENVIVTKYVDDTLESPVVAYEIESARSAPARIRLTEQLVGDGEALSEQPLNEGWSIEDDSLVFEATTEPGETIKTMIGRQDCPKDRVDTLLTTPTVDVEPEHSGTASDSEPTDS